MFWLDRLGSELLLIRDVGRVVAFSRVAEALCGQVLRSIDREATTRGESLLVDRHDVELVLADSGSLTVLRGDVASCARVSLLVARLLRWSPHLCLLQTQPSAHELLLSLQAFL